MHLDPLLVACAVHSFGFAVFHLSFWRLFDWPRSLAGTTRANRAIVQIANLRLTYGFVVVGVMCLVFPGQLRGSSLGHALAWAMSGFWVGRTIEQLVFLRIHHPMVHALTASFVVGAGLFAWAAV